MAGGFFSGGSSDAVNASVAEAEAAAREAEAARDEINNKFVEYAGQTEEGSYTVPNADDTLTTKFLNQEGNWAIPAVSSVENALDDLTDVVIVAPTNDQILAYDSTLQTWGNVDPEVTTDLTAGTGLNITNDVINISDDGVGTNQLATNAVTSAKIGANVITRVKIADNAIDDDKLNATNTGTANQILSAVGDGSFTWIDADGNTAYTASDGISLVSDDFSLTDSGVTTVKINDGAVTSAKILNSNVTADELNVTGDGTSGQILSSDGDGSFTWVDNTGGSTYTADGTTLNLTGTVFSVADGGIDTTQIAADAVDGGKLDATNTPTAGQFLTANLDNTFTWVTPAAGTAYTAGTGLDLTADEFSISDGGVDTTQLADNSVNADKLNVTGNGTDGQVLTSDGDGSFTWESGGTTLRGLTDTNIPASITDRRFLEYNTDTNVWDTVSATNFLNISELFDVDITNIQNNQFLRYNTTDGRWENESISIPNGLSGGTGISIDSDVINIEDGGVGTTQLADSAVTNAKLGTGAVNSSKIFDGAITTSKILDANVTPAKLGTIPISTLSDVDSSGINNGQILAWNGTEFTPVNNNGGGGNSDNSRLGITLAPTSLTVGEENTSIAITLAIVDAISGETISGQSVTVTDPQGHAVTVTGSENSWSFMGLTANAGNYVIRASATFTTTDATTVHTASANLPVHASNPKWYVATAATQPPGVSSMTDQGDFSSPENVTYTANNTGREAYVALPTGSYTFHTGVLFADITDLGVLDTNFTLYRFDDFDDSQSGGTLTFTIMEA